MKKKNQFISVFKKISATFFALVLVFQLAMNESLLKKFIVPNTYASSISSFISGLSSIASNTNTNYIHSGNEVFGGDTLTFTVTLQGTFTLNSVSAATCSVGSQTSTSVIVTCTSAGFVSPSYNINSGAGPSGGITIASTSANFPAQNKTPSKSVTVTTASASTLGADLSPNTKIHSHVNPDDQIVSASCLLNGGSFVSFVVNNNPDVTDEPGVVSGSGSVSRTLTFTVRNVSMAPTTITVSLTCTTSVGATTVSRDFNFTNSTPVIDNPNITVPITRGSFNTQVTFSDADPDDDIVAGVTATHPDLTAQLFTPGNPATLDLTFDFNNNLVKNVTINSISDDHAFIASAPVTVTIPDDEATVSLDDSAILAHYGISSLSQLNAGVITANPGTPNVGINFADTDIVDATQAISCTFIDAPPGVTPNVGAAPFTGSGTVAASPYTSALTFNAGLFLPGFLTIECSMFGGNLIFSDDLQFGSGGRRRESTISVLLGTDLNQVKTEQKNEQDELTAIAQGIGEGSLHTSAKRICEEYTLLVDSEGKFIVDYGQDVPEEFQKTLQLSADASLALETLYSSGLNYYDESLFAESQPKGYVFEEGLSISLDAKNEFRSSYFN